MRRTFSVLEVPLISIGWLGAIATALAGQAPVDPCDVGAWEAPFNHGGVPMTAPCGTQPIPGWPSTFEAIHMALIPKGAHQGHVLVWDYIDYIGRGTGQGETRVIRYSIIDPDPATRQFWNFWHCLAPDLGDLFCAGQAWNAKGDLVIAGGTTSHAPHNNMFQWGGAKFLYVWEPPAVLGTGGTWHFDASKLLDAERWYPSVVMLGPDPNTDEDKLAVLGGTHNNQDVNSYQVLREVPGFALGVWESNGPTNTFAGPSIPNAELGDYARVHYLSTREMITAGFPVEAAKTDHFTFPHTWSGPWTMSNKRIYGSSVSFPISPGGGMKDTIVAMGGMTAYLPSNGIVLSDAQAWGPGFGGWVGPPTLPYLQMLYPRWVFNTVLLSDSTILAVGGEQYWRHLRCSQVPALVPELFKGGMWRAMAPGTIIRDYHSTALLLRSGAVLTGGGASRFFGPVTCPATPPIVHAVADYQIWSPPNLNCGYQRPAILFQNTTLPNNYWTWQYGAVQTVAHSALPLGVSIAKAVLLRVGAVTHHADTNQRCVELPLTVPSDPPTSVQVAVPTKASYLLPRGFYMLFLLTNQGTPSHAAFVRIQG